MTQRGKRRLFFAGLAVFALYMLAAAPAAAQAKQRDVMEFVNAQGTFCFPDGSGGCLIFVPPVNNFFGWIDPTNLYLASFDYSGQADKWIKGISGGSYSFNTSFSGKVTETPMQDGRALVHVVLKTKNALTWVAMDTDPRTYDFTLPLVFGNRADDVWYANEAPALGDCYMEVKFINPKMGDPIPDLTALYVDPKPGQEVLLLKFLGNATEYHDNGTETKLQVTQVGLEGNQTLVGKGDTFPAEHVKLH